MTATKKTSSKVPNRASALVDSFNNEWESNVCTVEKRHIWCQGCNEASCSEQTYMVNLCEGCHVDATKNFLTLEELLVKEEEEN